MKNHWKFALVILSVMMVNSTSFGQGKDREIGLKTHNLSNYYFLYKQAKAPNNYLRFDAGLDANLSLLETRNATDLDFAVGFEKRLDLAKSVQLLHGWMPGVRMRHEYIREDDVKVHIFSPGLSLGYIIGVQYNINEKLSIGTELIPRLFIEGVFYRTEPDFQAQDQLMVRTNLNTRSSAGLFFIYKFNR